MAKKQVIRLTEGDLHKIIKETVNKILKEENFVDNESLSYDELYNHFLQQGYSKEGAQSQARKEIYKRQNNKTLSYDELYNHFLQLGFTKEGAHFHARTRIAQQQNNERKKNLNNAYKLTPNELQRLNKLLQSND